MGVTDVIGDIQLMGTLGKPCRHCGYRCHTSWCLCEGEHQSPDFCPRCGSPRELPLNAETREEEGKT